ESVFFDSAGRRARPDAFLLAPARVVLRRLASSDTAVDLSTGRGEVPLLHPEAVASAECKPLQCEMQNGKLIARGASSLVNTIEIKLHLVPHVFIAGKEGLEPQP